jgi:hypothetical protein
MRENDFATPFHPEEVRTARVCNMRSVSGRRKKVVRDGDAKETSCNNGGEGWETSVGHGENKMYRSLACIRRRVQAVS